MFIALALANLRIYLFGGLLLAVIAILAIAMANYTEDKRTLALLRIRGVAPATDVAVSARARCCRPRRSA